MLDGNHCLSCSVCKFYLSLSLGGTAWECSLRLFRALSFSGRRHKQTGGGLGEGCRFSPFSPWYPVYSLGSPPSLHRGCFLLCHIYDPIYMEDTMPFLWAMGRVTAWSFWNFRHIDNAYRALPGSVSPATWRKQAHSGWLHPQEDSTVLTTHFIYSLCMPFFTVSSLVFMIFFLSTI